MKEIKDNSMKRKVSLSVNSIVGRLPTDTIIEENNSNDEKVKIKYFKKVCAYDRVIVTLNADINKHLNYETSTNGDSTGNVCKYCHDTEKLNFFGLPKKIQHY